MPLRNALPQLPNETLTMKLLFSNGMTSYWQIGGDTVAALEELQPEEDCL
jgi:hypothetical protein